MMETHAPHLSSSDPSLDHLRVELARIDALIRRAVYRWIAAGQDPGDDFRGLRISDAEAQDLLGLPFAGHWGHMAALPPDLERSLDEAAAAAQAAAEQLAEAAPPRLLQLASAFDLDRFDLDAVLVCLAPALDLRYARLYAFLQDDVTRRRPTVNLVLDLLCPESGLARVPYLLHFSDDRPLISHGIILRYVEPSGGREPLLAQTLALDEAVQTWLLGSYQPAGVLAGRANLSTPAEPPLTDALTAGLLPSLERLGSRGDYLALFHGPDTCRQEAAADLLAARAGRKLLRIDLGAVSAQGPAEPALRLALRDARLTGALPYLENWDALLGAAGAGAAAGLQGQLVRYPGPVIVTTRAFWQPAGVDRRRLVSWLEFPIPGYQERKKLWSHFLRLNGMPAGQEQELDRPIADLAGQFTLTATQIRDAAITACDRAAERAAPVGAADLYAAARAHSSSNLAALARKITPRFGWDDIVLPHDQVEILREIVATVRSRSRVLEEWGVGRKLTSSNGITILFAGPPGTGKTMGAEVIAADLRLDVYKIDLSTVVSKYIGETEKNLEQIFREAQNSNAILFFDEADAIFGKRSEVKDAHDRYANIEISYLLQRMEAYDGVTILATNLRANLDEAFTRRLQFAVDFPFPEDEYRLRIWKTLFPPGVPRADDLDFGLLARRFKLSGGNIRNVIVNAAYLAAADGQIVGMSHLLHAVRRELQKMGRLVNERDLVP